MINELLYRLGVKEKPRSEKVKDTLSDAIHTVASALDEMAAKSREEAPKVAKEAQKQAEKARKEAPKVAKEVQKRAEKARKEAPKAAKKAKKTAEKAGKEARQLAEQARHQASDIAETVRERTEEPREGAVEAVMQGAQTASTKTASLLAALGALTADWDEIAKSLVEELTPPLPSEEKVEKRTKKAVQKLQKQQRALPGFWVGLLRFGVGFWYIDHLRDKDLSAYVNTEAVEQMRAASEGHPVQWYKELLDDTLIPNASLVAVAEIVGSALVALGYVTGINRRFASLLGFFISANNLLTTYRDQDKRGEHLVLALTHLLLLRTGG
ncbi:MAG: hypothetical protein M3220_15395 [Chloroflexota bacterium]|nr:hypothetical protein [Chloroflexota bacterium]